ncbi:MAG: acyltransferase [Chromatiales bacterium]|nr:acyltransferase [Chromatiales bacterium]
MRKIGALPIVTFLILAIIAISSGILATRWSLGGLDFGDFRGVILTLAGIVFCYAFLMLVYRIFIRFFPIKEGLIEPESRDEFAYHVYVLFYLMFFYTLTRNGGMPVPLMRVVYIALGAKLGSNTYSGGIILDPPLFTAGSNTIIGEGSILAAHNMLGDKMAHAPITLGSNVTIGGGSLIGAGVQVGDGAKVLAGSLVNPGTTIGPGETWFGVPARRLRGGLGKRKYETREEPAS